MDVSALREQFPVLDGLVYLNAGTDGPLPAAAAEAAAQLLHVQAREGRAHQHFERRAELNSSLRAAYASILGCPTEDLALTTCTSEGLALVLGGLDLAAGDEILTSDEEHPGLLGSLAGVREVRGVDIRAVPWAEVPAAIGPRTRLVACSHVSWMTGRVISPELAHANVPVLLDGAQGVGAIPTDVRALRCAAYAGPGQKWLCGPDGTGMLYISPELRERVAVSRRGYPNLEDPGAGLQARLHDDARRLDALSLNAETVAGALAAYEVLERCGGGGWDHIHQRARLLAARFAEQLAAHGREVVGRQELPGARDQGAGAWEEGVGARDQGAGAWEEGVGARDQGAGAWEESAGARDQSTRVEGEREVAGGAAHGTLVTFSSADPPAERERLAARGIVLRDIPERPWLRASVGAWNDEGDLARLLDALDK